MAKKIKTDQNARPEVIMAVVARTADELGFSLDQVDATNVIAHDGGKKVTGSATATKARLAIEVEPGRVKVSSKTTGAAYAGAADVGFFNARINCATASS